MAAAAAVAETDDAVDDDDEGPLNDEFAVFGTFAALPWSGEIGGERRASTRRAVVGSEEEKWLSFAEEGPGRERW